MNNLLSSLYRYRKRWLYGVLSSLIATSIFLSNIQPAYSVSWIELLIRGAQVFQLSNISEKQEVSLGKEINQQLIKSGRAKILRNSTINRYINNIGQKLAKTSKRPNLPYTFQVVDDKSVNAFATMGGFVYVNTGLILKAENEAELASVIGHEIGHIVGRHSIKQMRSRAIAQGIMSASGLERTQAVQLGVELAVNRRNSRQDELEADNLGLNNIKKAGYAPSGMISFMKKLLQKGNSVPTFLSTHPATNERIKLLQENVDPKTANVGTGLNQQEYRSFTNAL